MPSTQAHPQLLLSLSPELRSTAIEQLEPILLAIVRANHHTQYASEAPILADFRDAMSARRVSASDGELVSNFRRFVPLSDYGEYKPYMAAFNKSPCSEAELNNLFAPGLPYTLALSSATSGKDSKIFPKYNSSIPSTLSGDGPVAAIYFYGYRELKYVEREPGHVVKKIPVSNASSGIRRAMLGWTNVDEDDSRMRVIASGFVAPFAASMISNHESFLIIHGLFTLACRDVDRIVLTFSTIFYDMLRYMEERWDVLLSSIKNGTIPDLPGLNELHSYLQVHFHADPDRAVELSKIGPPFSCEAWAAHVWPKLRMINFNCSGPFASVLPKVQSIVGTNIPIQANCYASTESSVGVPYRLDDPHTFVLRSDDFVEFLDVTTEASHETLLQAWDLVVGKQYEIVLTTRDGLWRYRLGDVIDVAGFHPENGFPVFVLSGRRSLAIRLEPVLVSDTDIMSAVQAISPDALQVNEFTTLLDDREDASTLGYLIELAGTPGPNAQLASLKLSKGLGDANTEFRIAFEGGEIRVTVRIVRTGTFAAFRHWKAAKMRIGPGQVKAPVVLLDEVSRKWMLERVVGEL